MARINGYSDAPRREPVRTAREIVLPTCTLRTWRLTDAESLVRHANNVQIWRNLHDAFPFPYTRKHADEWVKSAATLWPATLFAITVEGKAVGGIGFHAEKDVHRRTAVIGYWLGERYWGRGIATEAVRAMSDYAFRNFDFIRLQAFVFEWNDASRRVLEKAGYTQEARLRRHCTKEGRTADVFLYALLRE